MAPRKASKDTKAAAKKKVAAKGYKLPDPIEPGLLLTDVAKNTWKIGKSIGQGGFGEIYLASENTSKNVDTQAKYVVKIEPHSNGPLFTEMHCYMRIAKPEHIESWMKEKKLKRLGMPKYLGSGSVEYKGQKYRFMVMERFGSDLQKILEQHNKKLSFKTVIQSSIQILDVLEYIHSKEYIHADIKASNLLIGYASGTENQLFLVDYGLACRYTHDNKHKDYKYDQRKAHDGTIEFTSRDAHIGAHSRRGDLEILGYNIVQWLCGRLPWEDNLQDCTYVANQKRKHMDDVSMFMRTCFPEGPPPGVKEYIDYVASLTFDEKPNYEQCRVILRDGLRHKGYKDDGKLIFLSATPKQPSKKAEPKTAAARKRALKRSIEEQENICLVSDMTPPKVYKGDARLPCKPRNFNSRVNTRLCPQSSILGSSLSKPSHIVSKPDSEEMLIEKENQKMLARKLRQRPRRLLNIQKDKSLDNPTPQMLAVMAKIREKSISPPICNKKHRHNGACQQWVRTSPVREEVPTSLTPEMEAVIRRKQEVSASPSRSSRNRGRRRRSYSYSSVSSCLSSPQLFESDNDDSDYCNETTVYYSPCGGVTSDEEIEATPSPPPPRVYKGGLRGRRSRRCKKSSVSPGFTFRVTRSSAKQFSPEIC